MTTQTATSVDSEIREKIIKDPGLILDDRDLMNALVAANEQARGENIVDLRSIAMGRLEERLDRLEDTHKSVIAAAYDNLAGTNMIHRAVLKLLGTQDFSSFMACLQHELPEVLRVDYIRLVLETRQATPDAELSKLSDILIPTPEGFISEYVTHGRPRQDKKITLRQVKPEDDMIFGEAASWIGSEACMKLDLGEGQMPGLLVLGAEDPHQFSPTQGTDLLGFFAGCFERNLQRWLS